MNGSINVIKFVFAVFVMLCHLGTTFGYDKIYYFQGSFIFVDWFFIFAGFTLAKKILSLDKNVPIAETSFSIIKKYSFQYLFNILKSTKPYIIHFGLLFYITHILFVQKWQLTKPYSNITISL